MTIIKGEIESLKRIKTILGQNGISRFNSIADIKSFISNYEYEIQETYRKIEEDLDLEIEQLYKERQQLKESYEELEHLETNKLTSTIEKLRRNYEMLDLNPSIKLLKPIRIIQRIYLRKRINYIEKYFDKIIINKTTKAFCKIKEIDKKIEFLNSNRGKFLYSKSSSKIEELNFIKSVVDSINTHIAGAIGENLVACELQKLSDKYILYNDFSIHFDTPVYNGKTRQRIHSIQIDHLLVTNTGIFIIETKNWSDNSIENLNLKSPVKQIRRSSYALFILLNGQSSRTGLKLKAHHWGERKVPIRNLIVMIKNKPKEKFKFVKILTLKEVNNYINYFDPIFDDSEILMIAGYLEGLKN